MCEITALELASGRNTKEGAMSSVTDERRLQMAINKREVLGRSLKDAFQVGKKGKNTLDRVIEA